MPKLNRQQRRKLAKVAKNKLTDSQYKNYLSQSHDETVKLEVNNTLDRVWKELEGYLRIAMKENKISEERTDKIFSRVYELASENHIREVRS